MRFQKILVPAGGVVLLATAYRPIGYVGSAVMLNARLKPGMTLLHVVAMTQSLGEHQNAQVSPAP